jgi:hypothetical protein
MTTIAPAMTAALGGDKRLRGGISGNLHTDGV